MKPEFVAINESLWDPHPVGLATSSAGGINYSTIVESERGPEIVEHKNTIATQLHIETKYEETVKLLGNFVDKKFELISNMSKADMTLDEAENYLKAMMYTKGPNIVQTTKIDAFKVKTRGQSLFINKNSFGIETNSVRKEAIRPNTARTGSSTISCRNFTTRASSRQSGNRATTASTNNRLKAKPRLFSAERKLASFDDQQSIFNKSKLLKEKSIPNSLISFFEGHKITKADKKLIK